MSALRMSNNIRLFFPKRGLLNIACDFNDFDLIDCAGLDGISFACFTNSFVSICILFLIFWIC